MVTRWFLHRWSRFVRWGSINGIFPWCIWLDWGFLLRVNRYFRRCFWFYGRWRKRSQNLIFQNAFSWLRKLVGVFYWLFFDNIWLKFWLFGHRGSKVRVIRREFYNFCISIRAWYFNFCNSCKLSFIWSIDWVAWCWPWWFFSFSSFSFSTFSFSNSILYPFLNLHINCWIW